MHRIINRVLAAGLLLMAAGGCGFAWVNVKDTTETPGAVKVMLESHDGEDFHFAITNEGQQPISVLVNSVKLIGPRKSVSPEVGHPFMGVGAMIESVSQGTSPTVAPGQTTSIFAHFDLDDADIKKGDPVRIDFSAAILQAGQPVPVAPLEFQTR